MWLSLDMGRKNENNLPRLIKLFSFKFPKCYCYQEPAEQYGRAQQSNRFDNINIDKGLIQM